MMRKDNLLQASLSQKHQKLMNAWKINRFQNMKKHRRQFAEVMFSIFTYSWVLCIVHTYTYILAFKFCFDISGSRITLAFADDEYTLISFPWDFKSHKMDMFGKLCFNDLILVCISLCMLAYLWVYFLYFFKTLNFYCCGNTVNELYSSNPNFYLPRVTYLRCT